MPILRRRHLTLLVLIAVVGGSGCETPTRDDSESRSKRNRPNVVVIMTDDQDPPLVRFMPAVQRLLARKGVSFRNSVVSNPLCCPSRATLLTGQYAHNHGVLSNSPPAGGLDKLEASNSLPVWLSDAGYRTSYVGKYLNGYRGPDTPPGWDRWAALTRRATRMYRYEIVRNGHARWTGRKRKDYKTKVLGDLAVRGLRRELPKKHPLFLVLAPNAPHSELGREDCIDPRSGPQSRPRLHGAELPTPSSFGERDVSDKPDFVRRFPRPDSYARYLLECRFRSRARSLRAVDDVIARMIAELKRAGELQQTLVIFTSDNGYMQGEHRIPSGKVVPYEESIRVPLILRGPGVPHGAKREQLAANVDWAPTILDAARAPAGLDVDGRSLLPLARDPDVGVGRDVLLEAEGFEEFPGNPTSAYAGVRTERWMYARYESGERELYDLRSDPGQLENLASRPDYARVRERLSERLRRLRNCAGESCR